MEKTVGEVYYQINRSIDVGRCRYNPIAQFKDLMVAKVAFYDNKLYGAYELEKVTEVDDILMTEMLDWKDNGNEWDNKNN